MRKFGLKIIFLQTKLENYKKQNTKTENKLRKVQKSDKNEWKY